MTRDADASAATRPRRSRFGPYVLDRVDHRLWKGEDPVPLPPKAFDLLSHLVANAGVLATKDELLDALWPETYVSDAVLKVTVGELRRALGDRAQAPAWIQTVHRKGYRFIGRVESDPPPPNAAAAGSPVPPPRADDVVGRTELLGRLTELFAEARTAERRTVFLTGAPGVGKTAVVDRIVEHLASHGALVARGQCRESYGEGEAYLPILEAVGGLCKGEYEAEALPVLSRHAPSWLIQMPWVLGDEDRATVEAAARHAGRERMLREVADGFEELGRDRPVVLVLEDLHWSDPSTVDVLSTLAQRTGPARLLIVGTYRPIEARAESHPVRKLAQDLRARGRCTELPVDLLPPEEIAAYLTRRFGVPPPAELVDLVHRRTEGNALFLVVLASDLLEQGCVARDGERLELRRPLAEIEGLLPDELKQILARHVERLPDETVRLLECASVVGREFTARLVADVLEEDASRVEGALEELGRRQDFVRSEGVERIAGGVTGRYRFEHVLHRHALYDRVGAVARAALHGKVADRLAAEGAGPAELAYHFDAAARIDEAIESWHRAGDVAVGRKASVEAIGHFERALEAIAGLPDTRPHEERELRILTAIGPALGNVHGHGAPRVEEVYARARELADRIEAAPELMGVLAGLFQFYVCRARMPESRRIAEQLRRITDRESEPLVRRSGQLLCGVASTYLGELRRASDELESTIALAEGHDSLQWGYLADGQACAFAGQVHYLLGDEKTAIGRAEEAVELGVRAGDPYAEAIGHHFSSVIHRWRRDTQATRASVERLLANADENGFELWRLVGRWTAGWVRAASGGVAEGLAAMDAALRDYAATGNETAMTDYLASQAEVCVESGATDRARELIDQAGVRVERNDERFYEAEVHRIRGVVLAAEGDPQAAEAVRTAIEVARGQGARAWELRAWSTLGELGAPDAAAGLARLSESMPDHEEAAAPATGRLALGRDSTD